MCPEIMHVSQELTDKEELHCNLFFDPQGTNLEYAQDFSESVEGRKGALSCHTSMWVLKQLQPWYTLCQNNNSGTRQEEPSLPHITLAVNPGF